MKRFLLIVILMLGMAGFSFGQGCSVCTKTAAGLNNNSARGLNGGIIYLAFLPLAFMGTVGFLWWRSNRNSNAGQ